MTGSMMIRKGDKVRVIAGKDKGKEGRVLRTAPRTERAFVEGVNIQKRHTRPTQKIPQGGIVEIEGPIHISNLMLVCPSCSQPTRVGSNREDGVRQRVCKKCEKEIDS
jgi:large subunit ribosomal protein L24